jgi:phenylpropionate dioxygenase-like ring-hydroxylating dioxygenase large terminal subunit
MIRYFNSKTKTRATVVHDVFSKYLESTREFWKTTQRRAMKGSRDWNPALQRAFRLQQVLIDRQALRFGYLLAGDALDSAGLRSLNDITVRLDQGWSEAEEARLIESNPTYEEVVREIKDIQSNWDPNILAEPLQELQRDEKYHAARRALADKVQELEDQLRRSQ